MKMTLVHPPTHPTPTSRNSMSSTCQLLLTRFGTHLKVNLFGTIFNRLAFRHITPFRKIWVEWKNEREWHTLGLFNIRCHVLPGHLSISAISQLLLNQFWPNFEGRFLGSSLLDAICQDNFFPDNICPGNICSLLITQFVPNFLDPILRRQNFFFIKIFVDTNFFLPQNYFD